MKKLILISAVIAFSLVGVEAFTQDDAVSEDVTEYFMDAAGVEGETFRPEGVGITSRRPGKSKSLIKVRRHFVVEMIKAVEDI